MRLVLLAAVLASACDQGAAAAPYTPAAPLEIAKPVPSPYVRYAVQDDADFVAKATVVLRELGEMFADGSKDCELVASRVETFGARNVTRFAVLTEYGRAHPGAEKKLQEQFKPQLEKVIEQMTPVVSACSSSKRMMNAFAKLSEAGQLQQRPR